MLSTGPTKLFCSADKESIEDPETVLEAILLWETTNVGDQYASLSHLRLARPEWLLSSDNGLTNIQLKYYVKSKLLK